MPIRRLFTALSVALLLASPAFAQFPGNGTGGSSHDSDNEEQQSKSNDSKDDEKKDQSGADANGGWEMPATELDLPLDERIHVHVEPFVPGSVVDRIIEPAAVTVTMPDCSQVEVFVVAVDAPYGGKALEKPRLIGKDDKPADGFKVMWTGKEKSLYVKVFAVITKRTGVVRRFRSHTLDFGMAGSRLDAAAAGVSTPKPTK